MYKIEEGTIADYAQLATTCIESGKLDFQALQGCHIDKLVNDNKILVIIGYKEMEFDDYPGKPFILVSGVFDKTVTKHVRVLKEVGGAYLDSIQKYPLIALAQQDNRVYGRFLEVFGFSYTNSIEKDSETGIIYKVYVRY